MTLAAATEAVAEPEPAARRALGVVDLDPDDSKRVSGFSKGMRQRVKLAAALVHDPEVLILDEPLTGLDPVQRRRMIELFHGLGDEGRCVLVSSHVLEEVARLGSRILLIAQGRLAATGDYRELRELMDDRPHRIRIAVDRPRQFAAALVESGTAVGVSVGRTLSWSTPATSTASVGRSLRWRSGSRLACRGSSPSTRTSSRCSATWWRSDDSSAVPFRD